MRNGIMVKIKNIVIWLITVFNLHAFGEKAETINPFDLTCEYLKDPLDMDHPAPRLSWKLRSDARDQKRTAYRILVSDQPEVLNRNEENIWDSEEIHHGHQKTGVFGSRYLHYVLGEYGYGKTVQKMLNLDSYPGYGYLISLGATTFWENWGEPAFEDRPGIAGNDRSKSHPFQGGFDAWFYQGIAGIHPDPQCPGFRHIIFRPQLTDVLTYAKADFNSVSGTISSQWENQSSGFIWSVSVPVNTTTTVFLPTNGQQEIREGNQPISQSKSIKIFGTEDGFTQLRIGSGTYLFTVR